MNANMKIVIAMLCTIALVLVPADAYLRDIRDRLCQPSLAAYAKGEVAASTCILIDDGTYELYGYINGKPFRVIRNPR